MSRPLRVMSVFGTRPDTIKMAPVVQALQNHAQIECIVCVTAQHRQMLDDLLDLFEIRPHFDLDIMTPDQTLTDITTRVLIGMEGVLKSALPDVVLVHGDTTTSTAAALAAFYQQIPVGHVEAGLRTSDPWVPFPEEMNRRLTGTIASYHFSPTELAREHLLRENVPAESVIVTGNTVIDAFLATAKRRDLGKPPGWERLDTGRPIILVTAHRRENHAHMREMCEAMRDIVHLPAAPQILWPVHPSPRVRPVAYAVLGTEPAVMLDDPLDYAQMVAAVRECTFVLTDSGGIQEEAPVPRQARARHARGDRAARRRGGRHAGACRTRACADRFRCCSAALEPKQIRANVARGKSIRRRSSLRAHSGVAAGAAASRYLSSAVPNRTCRMKPSGAWSMAAAGATFAGSVIVGLALSLWLGGREHQQYILAGLFAGIAVGGYSAYRLVASALTNTR